MNVQTTSSKRQGQKQTGANTGKHPEETVEIILLANSIYFFLQCVFIIVAEGCFRLVVLHNKAVLTDLRYKKERGAKIAFSKLYNEKAWEKGVKAQWTHPYPPDAAWLEDKLKQAKGH
jgi:hypothetical protein